MLLARLAGGFQAPLTKAAGLFQAFTRNFAYGLKAYVDQRVEGGEALPAEAEDTEHEATDTENGGRCPTTHRAAETEAAPAAETDAAPAAETEATDAERAPAGGASPAAASDAGHEES